MGSFRLQMMPLLGVALALSAGCVRPPLATCPDKGGTTWLEVDSPHFRVFTDLGPRVARLSALELEQLRFALLLVWGSHVDPPGQVEVIVAKSDAELQEFTLGGKMEAFLDSSGRIPLMVMAGDGVYLLQHPESFQVQAHELAHYISRFVMVRQPRWLSEGLATWLQTVQFSNLHRKATFGGFPPNVSHYAQHHLRLPLEELWAWDQHPEAHEQYALPYYATSWLWVMYLLDRQPERFRDFRERLSRAEDPRQAWKAAFKDVPRLEEDFQKYQPPSEEQLTVELPRIDAEFEVRELDCAEIHTLRARLFLRSPGRRSVAERLRLATDEVKQALKEDPTNVSAVQLQEGFTAEPEKRLALAQALVQARPNSGPAWSLLGQVLQDVGAPASEQARALQRALELEPEDVDALVAMAWVHTEQGQTAEGLSKAEQAVRLAPGRASTLEAYAALLFQAGRCPESVTAQQRAIGVLSGHITEALRPAAEAAREAMRRKLEEYAQHCPDASTR